MGAKPPRKRILKITGIVLVIILALVTGFHFWFKAHAKHLLEDLVETKSNGKLKIKIEKLSFGYFSNKMEIENAVFYNTDTINENTAYRFAVTKIKLEVKALWPVLFKKQFLIDSLHLFEPDIQVTRLRVSDKKETKKRKDVSIPEEMGKVYNTIRDAMKVLKVKRFQIDNGKFTLINKIQPDQQPLIISHLNFHIDNFQVDTSNISSKEKILFSDNIVLSSYQQNIIFPDGRHRLSFKSFSIDLQKKLVQFDNCTIAATRDDSSKASFNVYLDALYLTNIDFDTLYKSEVIKADSVYCVNPTFTLEVELGKKKESNKPPPKLEDIVKQLTGDLQLGRLVVANADFNIKTVRDGVPNSFTFSQNNFEMEGLNIDQEAPKSIKVKSFTMAIRNYENFIKDSTYSIQFDSVVLKDDRITLSNFVFNKLYNGKILNTFSIPQFNLQGLSWDDLVFEKRLKAEQAIMFRPHIVYTVSNQKKRDRQNIFQSLGAVNEYMDLQYLDVIDGTIDLRIKDDLLIKLDSATLAIESHSLLTSTKLAGIKNSLTRLYFKKGNIRVGNTIIELDKIRYIGESGQFEAGTIYVTNDAKNMMVTLQDAAVQKIRVDEVNNKIYADGVTWQRGDVKINAVTKTDAKPLFLELRNVHGLNTSMDGTLGAKQISTKISTLSFDELIKHPGSKLKLSGLSVEGKQLQVKNGGKKLSVLQYNVTDNSNSYLHQIVYKSKNENVESDIAIPSLTLIPRIQPLINGNIILDAAAMVKPIINISLVSSNTVNSANNNSLPPINISDLNVTQPSIQFTRVRDSSSFSFTWHGENNTADFLQMTGLVIHPSSTINTTLKSSRFYLSDFVFSDAKGKKYSTGEGKINAQIRDIDLVLENNLPAEWQGVVTSLEAKDFRLDSLGKKYGSLVMNSAALKELHISSSNVINLQKLASENPAFQLKQLTGSYTDADKQFMWHNASFNRDNNIFSLDSISFRPLKDRDAFLAGKTFQTDYITAKTGAILLGPVDLDKYITDDILSIGKAHIANVYMYNYKDKRLPQKEKLVKPLPVALIKQIPVKLSLDTLILDDADFEYTEINPKTFATTVVPVKRLNAKIFPVRNYDVNKTDSLHIHAEAYLLGNIWLRLRVKESYADSLQGFLMTLRVKPTDMQLFNPLLIPTSSIKIQSGFLDTLNLRVLGRDDLAFGEMQMFYRDLKVKLLKRGEDQKKNASGFINFILNSFIVKNKNSSRTGSAFLLRDRQRSAINYLLRIAMSGITNSVGGKNNRKVLKDYKEDIDTKKLPPPELE